MRAHPAGKLGEGATAVSGAELCERQFQSTPPARGRLEKILLRLKKTAISIHAPREGGRLPSEYPGSGANDISIHAPARGGDAAYQLKIDALEISIHAPARGGRHISCGQIFHIKEFQSTPPRGGRPPWRSSGPSRAHNFNPRPREGGDIDKPPCYVWVRISIHAPARGATSINLLVMYGSGFQSTPPRGGRPVPLGPVIAITDISIHAPARGATYAGGAGSQSVIHFNPRPREGGDGGAELSRRGGIISIHAPARGATAQDAAWFHTHMISIHAPARGATGIVKNGLDLHNISIHAPARGGDPFYNVPLDKQTISIHAPARGGDR